MPNIHPTALVDATAQIAADVEIGAWTQIGAEVVIDSGTRIGSHCVITGRTQIGKNNQIFQFNSLGAPPQDMKYAGEPTQLVIGANNTIREFCTFNVGTVQGGGVTRIGNDNWIMATVHIAHDVVVGNHCILANYVGLAGHAQIGDWVTVGGQSGIHQFVHVGSQVMIGFGSALVQDVPPFARVDGNPLKMYGINSVGLKRRNFPAATIEIIKQAYRLLYRQGLALEQAVEQINNLIEKTNSQELTSIVKFINSSQRGIAR